MKRTLFIILLLLIILIPTGIALAEPAADRVVGEDDSVPNDVTIFDDDLEVTEGGEIIGDVVVWNGNATIAGTLRGDLVVMNGDLILADTAVIRGECVVMNGGIEGDANASVNCTNISGFLENLPPFVNNIVGDIQVNKGIEPVPPVQTGSNIGWNLLEVAGRTLLLGILAFVAATLLPQHMQRIQETVNEKPVASGVVGLLTIVAVPSLAVLLILISAILVLVCIGILGFPLTAVLLLGLFVATVFGWFVVGHLIGSYLARKMNWQLSQPAVTAFGTMLLTLIFGVLGVIPFVYGEGIVAFFAMCVGLGGVALTKFGTRDYPVEPVIVPTPKAEKVTAVLNTLPTEELDDEDTAD